MHKRILPLIKICRPLNVLIVFLTVIIAGLICSDKNEIPLQTFLASVSASFIAAAGYIINDFFDIKIDSINRPGRPLASGILSTRLAIVYYATFSISGLLLAILINYTAVMIAVLTIMLLFIYSYKIKSVALLGNFSIAVLTGLTFIYGGVSVNNISFAVIPALFALLINFIREIVKDMEDINGDIKNGIETFPTKFGFSSAKYFIVIITASLILFTCYPFIFRFYKIEYFIIVMSIVNPILVYVLVSIYKNDSVTNLNKLSFILKLDMIFGLSAIFLGK
ncbi:MAG: geranylgeranylglycerol-phosphate geranylgeranyltransferase [Ignavibacteriaceae bacterium]